MACFVFDGWKRTMTGNLYVTDFFAWANEQAALLRAGKLSTADIEHIAEEIESMGKTEQRENAPGRSTRASTLTSGRATAEGGLPPIIVRDRNGTNLPHQNLQKPAPGQTMQKLYVFNATLRKW